MQDGIYFGLPEDEYHSIERFSKSGAKLMRISPADFWARSHLNPLKEELTPDQVRARDMAKLIGRAYHSARLEPETFEQLYCREPSKADYAHLDGFLHNATGIEAALAELGEPKKSKDDTNGVLSQAHRLRAAGYEGPIWHLLEEAAIAEKGDRYFVPASSWDQIVEDGKRLRMIPHIAQLLSNGEPEVSILYTCPETGLPMKSRIDWLGHGYFVELKTFANSNGKAFLQAVTDAVAYNRYHIDAVAYLQALLMAKRVALPVHGNQAQQDLIAHLRGSDHDPSCHFVFQQKGGVPNIIARKFRFWESSAEDALAELERDGATEEHLERARRMVELSSKVKTIIHRKGELELAAAKRDYLAYSDMYAPGEPWLPFDQGGEISDADFSRYFLEDVPA